jgi:hypothetical protein
MGTPKTVTSANAVLIISVKGVYDSPVPIQGFSTDTVFTTDAVVPSEVVMGVDGKISAGFVLHPHKQKIHLQPDSDSVELFDQWYAAQVTAKDIFFAEGQIELPSINKTYKLGKGVLTSYKQITDAKKVLQPLEYEITWETVEPAGV